MTALRLAGTVCSIGDAEAPLVFLDLDPVKMLDAKYSHNIDTHARYYDGLEEEHAEMARAAKNALAPYPKAIALLHSWGTADSTWTWGVLPNVKKVAGVAMLGGGGLTMHPHIILREFTIPTVIGLSGPREASDALRRLEEVVVKGGRQGLPARVHVSRRNAWLEVDMDGSTVSRPHPQV